LKSGDDVSIIPAIAGGAPKKKNSSLFKKRVTLVFPPSQIKEPAVFTMAKKFDIMPNIRQARVTETVGEMTLELEGTEKNLTKGIKFLESRGIKVEPVAGESAS
jgi:ABC-type methionine transport system ATPase subunit